MPRSTRTIALAKKSVRFDNGTVIEAPAFAGEVTQWRGRDRGLRRVMLPAERDVSPAFEAAFEENGIEVAETIHLDVRDATSGLRRGAKAPDTVVISPAPPPPNAAQVVLYQDESGGMSWHFPDGHFDAERRPGGLRARGRSRFTIPARTIAARKALADAPPSFRLRGEVTTIGRKIFKILLVPLSRLVSAPVNAAVGSIEKRYRQELIRDVTPGNYRTKVTTPFAEWSRLAKGRSLLIVHGIFSTTEGMLSGLPPAAMERLVSAYDGRVIALDQITASRTPEENARTFLEAVAKTGLRELEFDILSHSRGGIVARTLAERGKALVPQAQCEFRKVFFVATPNAGSPLADPRHIVEMIDVFTNWFTNFPDGPVMYSLEVILGIVKLIAFTAAAEVPGIAAMGTKGFIAKTLNRGTERSPALYDAAASNYEPDLEHDNAFFGARFVDNLADRVFRSKANDLIVPTDGVTAANGHPSFPIRKPLVFKTSDAVPHTGFFSRTETVGRIVDFLDPSHGMQVTAPSDAVVVGAPRPATDLVARGGRYDLGGGGMGEAFRSRAALRPAVRKSKARILVKERRGAAKKKGGGGRRPRAAKKGAPARRKGDRRAPLESTAVEREPEIHFHEVIEEGVESELTVRLSDVGGGAMTIPLTREEEETGTEITVSLHAPGFVVEPGPDATMIVKRSRDASTEEVTFRLTARRPGDQPLQREITAEFWHRNGLIGAVTHVTVVTPKGYTGVVARDRSGRSDGFGIPAVRREDCDLVLRVEGESDPGQPPFVLRVRCPLVSEAYESLNCGRLVLPSADLSKYINSALEQVLAGYPGDGSAADVAKWNRHFVTRLRDLGKKLWTFLPEAFRTFYFKALNGANPPRSLFVHSDEMIFPWELVVPHGEVGGKFVELDPLGIAHILGRWRPNARMRPSPQRMPAHAFVLVRPAYAAPDDLPWAEKEEKELRALLKGVEVLTPADEGTFRAKLLDRDDVRVVHYSGHGDFDPNNADLNYLLLENGTTIDAMAIASTTLGHMASPILYLNACSVGATSITVGRPGGFASGCIDGGYSGVIAPYWPVNDASAALFSVDLYKKLIAGTAMGQALQELRQANRDDPTYLAFAYFGDPWTRLDFSRVQAGASAGPKRATGRRRASVAPDV